MLSVAPEPFVMQGLQPVQIPLIHCRVDCLHNFAVCLNDVRAKAMRVLAVAIQTFQLRIGKAEQHRYILSPKGCKSSGYLSHGGTLTPGGGPTSNTVTGTVIEKRPSQVANLTAFTTGRLANCANRPVFGTVSA